MISQQEVLNFHISGSTKHTKVLKLGKGLRVKQRNNITDKRVLWDMLKYKIQLFTMDYSKIKA